MGRTTIVDPKLDRELAGSISETLANRQVLTVLEDSVQIGRRNVVAQPMLSFGELLSRHT